MRGYGKKGISPRMTLKIDIRKAYDSISRDFLKNLLIATGFPGGFGDQIWMCISSPLVFLEYKWTLMGFFKWRKCLRGIQRDPLSSSLFVLVMDYQSKLLDRAYKEKTIKHQHRCKKVSISHLLFVDDLFSQMFQFLLLKVLELLLICSQMPRFCL